jgi:glycosyltransferase involved in cell wall biosynthesis
MKVVHVEAGRHLYGGALQVLYLLRGLRSRGGVNILVCPRASAIAEAATGVADRIYPLPMGGDLDALLVPRLLRVLRRERPVLVHVHSRRGADLWGGLAARLAGIPAVLSRRVDNPLPAWALRWQMPLYDQVITISEAIREVLISAGVVPSKARCVHSAVDTDEYRPGCDRAWFHRGLGLAARERALGVVAQLIPRKGHTVLIDALPQVVARVPDVRVLIFGKGPLESHLKDLVAARGLEQHVRFFGFRQDLAKVLPCLDLLVHPALLEGLGVSLLQAAASGVPIVAARSGGVPEICRHEVNGLLVPPGDSSQLAGAVLSLIDDGERRRRYGQQGRVQAVKEFSIEAMTTGNFEVYQETVARRSLVSAGRV